MKSNTISMCILWFAMMVMGIAEIFFAKLASNEFYVISSAAITMFLILIWFIEDSRNINHQPSMLLKVFVVFFPFIAIPYYLVRYKGWRRTFRSMSVFFGWVLLYFVVMLLATLILEHVALV